MGERVLACLVTKKGCHLLLGPTSEKNSCHHETKIHDMNSKIHNMNLQMYTLNVSLEKPLSVAFDLVTYHKFSETISITEV